MRPALHLNLDSAALSAAADGHQYDSDEEFWYYEDGEFPQSEVSSTTLIKILESSAEMNGEAYVIGSESYAVWECGGGKYIKVTASGKNGTASDSGCTWFVVESIKWVVGYGEEEPSEVTSAVSAKVLTLGSYKTTNSEDLTYRSLFTSTSENSAQAVASGNLTSVVDSVIYDMFNTESVGQDYVYSVNLGNKTDDNTVVTKAGYRVASVSEIDEICGSFQAECSDLVAFLLTCNGTSTSGGDTVDYWTRDLAYYLSESDYYLGYYNSGVYVLADGSVSNCWLTETMGARLSVKIG